MKKPRGKTAQSQEPTPAIARLAFDPERGKGEFRLFGGAQHDEWNQHLIVQLAGSLPEARGSITPGTVERSLGPLTGQIGINPQDPVEAMLAAQMIAATGASLELYRRAWIPEQSFEVSTKYLALADKAARTLAMLSEALDRHRGKGQQQITVKHVTVNADQAVIADTIVGGSKAVSEVEHERDYPRVIEARDASCDPLQGALKKDRQAVPVTRR